MEELKYEHRIVAFIDILGFKELIKESEKDSSKLKLIHETLTFLKGREDITGWDLKLIEIEEDAQKKGVENFSMTGKIACTCFSDSIVVSVKIDNNINEMMSSLITHLSFIGAKLMTEGVLFRGAISYGKLIHQENGLLMGPAMIEAYLLESNVAKNPLVVLSAKLLKLLNYPLLSRKERYPYHQYLSRFDDGCTGFHQMRYFQVIESWTEMKPALLKSELRKIKDTILNGLDSSFENPGVHSKFLWLKSQYEDLIISNGGVKEKIYGLNEGTGGGNISFSHTDRSYYPENKDIKN